MARWKPTTLRFDADDDGDVDLFDFSRFYDEACLGGPIERNVADGEECRCVFNTDNGADVDLGDFAAFQNAFSPG